MKMAEPLMELDASDSALPANYDNAIINNNTVDGNKVLRWGDGDSADGAITNVTLPAAGNAWGPELWLEDTVGADILLCDTDEQPDAAVQRPMVFKLHSNDVAYATKPRISVFDDNTHVDTEEFIDGTVNHTSPFMKARGQTVVTAPPQFWGEANDAALHTLDGAGGGAIVCGDHLGNQENCALDGMNDYLEVSVLNIFGANQYFSLALSVPDDATTGVNAIDGVLSIRYTYT